MSIWEARIFEFGDSIRLDKGKRYISCIPYLPFHIADHNPTSLPILISTETSESTIFHVLPALLISTGLILY